MARVAGWVTLLALLGAMFGWVAATIGPFVLIVPAITLVVLWATGAIVYEQWWPFRHLFD